MGKEKYDFANLSNTELEEVSSLEKEMKEKTGKDIVLVAYEEKEENYGKV